MSEEIVIVTPTGFIEVGVEMEASISGSNVPYPPSITIESQGRSMNFGASWDSKYLIPVTPGKANVYATFGQVTTEKREVNIKPGEVTRVIFRFGK